MMFTACVYCNEPASVRRLSRGLGLKSHPKDGVINSENKLQELVFDCFRHRYDSCTISIGFEPVR